MNKSLQVVIEAEENPCHTTESFFTWDALRGINLDIVLLLVDGVLLFLLLVLILLLLLIPSLLLPYRNTES